MTRDELIDTIHHALIISHDDSYIIIKDNDEQPNIKIITMTRFVKIYVDHQPGPPYGHYRVSLLHYDAYHNLLVIEEIKMDNSGFIYYH